MNISDDQLRQIVERVVKNVASSSYSMPAQSQSRVATGRDGVFTTMKDAIEAAYEAFQKFKLFMPQERKAIIDEMRKVGVNHREELSRMVYDETKMGRYEDKLAKHINASTVTPGIEELETKAFSGKNGLCVEEYAPFGVIGSITPSTHPSETLISNAILMLSAGNTVVFNAHPSAKNVSAYALQLCNRAMVKAGAPANLLTCVAEPTIESANEMFNHEKVKLLSITGGPAVVEAAMKSNKKVLGAGPGNPPTIVDETANLALAAERITVSSSFDNNILCTAEKEIYVVESVFEEFMREMEKQKNHRLTSAQMDMLSTKVFEQKGKHFVVNRNFVGRNANVLAKEIGIHLPESTPLLFGETSQKHIFVQEEQLMPCIPIVRVKNFKQAMEYAIEAEHGYGHSANIFTADMHRATEFGRLINCSIFVINGGTYQGDGGADGEGPLSFTIATPTGESVTRPRDFARRRRVMTVGSFRFV